jgi:hypothetical protein
MGKLGMHLDSISIHGQKKTRNSLLILLLVLVLKECILCLKSADVSSILDDIGDDLMEGIDLVPLRIDLAPLLFELDKQFVGHDVAVLFVRCKRQVERARAYVVYVVSLFEMRDDDDR